MRPSLARHCGASILLAFALMCARAWAVPSPDGVDLALSRTFAWLSAVRAEPMASRVESFRRSAVEIECWHRLWVMEDAGPARDSYGREVAERIAAAAEPRRLGEMLREERGADALTEVALLAVRSRAHGLDPSPFVSALSGNRGLLEAEISRVPPSIRILYATLLPAAGIDPPRSLAAELPGGMLTRRPAEVDLTLADVYYLTHEIFALTDFCLLPLAGMAPEQEAYLLRLLPFYATFYAAGDNLDITGEILSCMVAAGLTDTHAYREGIRTLLERQNPDGSFGTPDPAALGRPVEPGDYLHATLTGMTALLLDRRLRNR